MADFIIDFNPSTPLTPEPRHVFGDLIGWEFSRQMPHNALHGSAHSSTVWALPGTALAHIACQIEFSKKSVVTTLIMQLQPVFRCSSLNALDPGSGREIPAICHDPGVWHGHFTPES